MCLPVEKFPQPQSRSSVQAFQTQISSHMKKALITLLIILGITSIGHAIMLPQPTRCLFIDFYDFEKVESVYFRADVATERREEIIETIKSAELRVAYSGVKKRPTPNSFTVIRKQIT